MLTKAHKKYILEGGAVLGGVGLIAQGLAAPAATPIVSIPIVGSFLAAVPFVGALVGGVLLYGAYALHIGDV